MLPSAERSGAQEMNAALNLSLENIICLCKALKIKPSRLLDHLGAVIFVFTSLLLLILDSWDSL